MRVSILLAAAAFFAAGPALAAAPPAAKPAPITNTFSFETGSEYTTSTGAYADFYAKAGLTHTFADGLIWGGSVQQTWKAAAPAQQETAETTLGYNFKIDPTFTITSSAGVGYLWDSSPTNLPAQSYAYYVVNAGLNAKLAPQWTWTVISARYRDAFSGGWQTPKLSTTLTYAFNSVSSIYASYGYGWKNGLTDKYSLALGFKLGF